MLVESNVAAVLVFNGGYNTTYSTEDFHKFLGELRRISPYRTTSVRNSLALFAC